MRESCFQVCTGCPRKKSTLNEDDDPSDLNLYFSPGERVNVKEIMISFSSSFKSRLFFWEKNLFIFKLSKPRFGQKDHGRVPRKHLSRLERS